MMMQSGSQARQSVDDWVADVNPPSGDGSYDELSWEQEDVASLAAELIETFAEASTLPEPGRTPS